MIVTDKRYLTLQFPEERNVYLNLLNAGWQLVGESSLGAAIMEKVMFEMVGKVGEINAKG